MIEAAEEAAREIEAAAAELGSSYHAAQTFYGVEVEFLVDDEWYRAGSLPEGAKAVAVRLIDCDGSFSGDCRSVGKVQKVKEEWIRILHESIHPEEEDQ